MIGVFAHHSIHVSACRLPQPSHLLWKWAETVDFCILSIYIIINSLPAIDGSLFSNHHRSFRRLELPNDIWTVCKCVFHWMLWWVPSEAIFLISVFWLITFVGASNEYVGHGPWQAKRLKNKLCNTYTTTCAYWVWAVERKSPWNQTMCL